MDSTGNAEFFGTLFSAASPDWWIELRALPRAGDHYPVQDFYPRAEVAALLERAGSLASAGYDVYFGVQPRVRKGGKAQDVAAVLALVADLDWGPGKAFVDISAAVCALEAFPVPPSITVLSGGGLHCYWLLSTPAKGAEMKDAVAVAGRIADFFGVDDVSDLPRILRVPGTKNWKLPEQPRPVELQECYPDRRYALSDFGFLADHCKGCATDLVASGSGSRPDGFPAQWAMGQAVGETGRNNAVFHLGLCLVRGGASTEVVRSVLRAANTRMCVPPLPDDEVLKIAKSVAHSRAAQDGATTSATIRIVRASEIPDVADEVGWLVEGLWTEEGLGVVGGEPKTFKTLLMLGLAVAVAGGGSFLGRSVPCAGPVLVYCAEDRLPIVRQRLARLARGAGLDLRKLAIDVIDEPVLRLDDQHQRMRFMDVVSLRHPRLVVLDPLRRLTRSDENDATQMSDLLGFLRLLQRQAKCAVAIVHHFRKSSGDPHERRAVRLRGSGDIFAAGDVYWMVERLAGGDRRVTFEMREVPEPDPINFRVEDPEGPDGAPDLRIAVIGTSGDVMEQRVLEALEGESLGARALREAVGGRGTEVDAARDRLLAKNRIELAKDGTGRKYRIVAFDAHGAWSEDPPACPESDDVPDTDTGMNPESGMAPIGVPSYGSDTNDSPGNDDGNDFGAVVPFASAVLHPSAGGWTAEDDDDG